MSSPPEASVTSTAIRKRRADVILQHDGLFKHTYLFPQLSFKDVVPTVVKLKNTVIFVASFSSRSAHRRISFTQTNATEDSTIPSYGTHKRELLLYIFFLLCSDITCPNSTSYSFKVKFVGTCEHTDCIPKSILLLNPFLHILTLQVLLRTHGVI